LIVRHSRSTKTLSRQAPRAVAGVVGNLGGVVSGLFNEP
jgi:hypothetical protein